MRNFHGNAAYRRISLIVGAAFICVGAVSMPFENAFAWGGNNSNHGTPNNQQPDPAKKATEDQKKKLSRLDFIYKRMRAENNMGEVESQKQIEKTIKEITVILDGLTDLRFDPDVHKLVQDTADEFSKLASREQHNDPAEADAIRQLVLKH